MRRASPLLSLLVGCGLRGAETPASVRELAGLERDSRALQAEVAMIRGLPNPRPAPLRFYAPREFDRLVVSLQRGEGGEPAAGDFGAFYASFGTRMPSRSAGTTTAEVEREQVVAFYHLGTHSVHVKRAEVEDAEAAESALSFLVHELGHSLQYQNLPTPKLARLGTDDERLAALALLEGDAMLVMLAWLANRNHVPLRRALVRFDEGVEAGLVERQARASPSNRRLASAPSLVSERMTFPYLGGLRFVGKLHRAGGLPLVDRAYSSPPATTEQVLHPERYLAGEAAVPVLPPPPPPGFVAIASGRMGELLTRTTFAQCLPAGEAGSAAEGWGGDAFTLARSAAGRLALVWSTTWDTEADAVEVERAAARMATCWAQASVSPLFDGGTLVRRRGERVALARGLAPSQAEPVMGSLLELPRDRPVAAPPHGAVQIPPRRFAPAFRPAYLTAEAFVSEEWGMSAPLARELEASVDRDGSFALSARNGPTRMGIALSEWAVTSVSVGKTFDTFEAGVESAAGRDLEPAATGPIPTGLGTGMQRTWTAQGSDVSIRLVLIDLCTGTGALLVSQVIGSGGQGYADWWLSALRPLWPGYALPVCAKLDP